MSSRFPQFVCTAIAGAVLLTASVAHAQDASDDLAGATAIGGTPFAAITDVTGATTAADEPVPDCMFPGGFGGHSVWYSYDATADAQLRADTFGSTYDTILVVWDAGPTGLAIGCNDDEPPGLQSAVTFDAQAGHTYYFQIASWREFDPFQPPPILVFNLAPPPPPFEATITLDPVGQAAGATGVVQIAGTVTCNRFGFVEAMVHVQQQHGRIAAAALFLQGPCGPVPGRAIARFVGQNARFTPGQATVTVLGQASEQPFFGGVPIYTSANVRLQGASPKTLVLPPPPQP